MKTSLPGKSIRVALLSIAGVIGAIGTATAATVLPVPGDGSGAVYGTYLDATGTMRNAILLDGIPIAFQYDEFWSYSAKTMAALQGGGYLPSAQFGTYSFSTGTGGLDVILFTGAGTQDRNQNVAGNTALDFQDPTSVPTGSNGPSSTDTWGDGSAAINGPVTVGDVVDYLHFLDPANSTPVFYVDWNQQGAGDSILSNAYVRVYDPTGTTVIAEWSLDPINNGTYDTGSVLTQAFNYGNISFYGTLADCQAAGVWNPITGVGCAGVTADGQTFTNIQHNLGSGKPDFIFFAPTMDLSAFNANDLFVVGWDIGCNFGTFPNGTDPVTTGNDKYTQGCLNNGYEEAFMTGALAQTIVVPEPGSLALVGLGLGLAGIGLARRKPIVS
jgi:hypothetical protein